MSKVGEWLNSRRLSNCIKEGFDFRDSCDTVDRETGLVVGRFCFLDEFFGELDSNLLWSSEIFLMMERALLLIAQDLV